MNTPVAKVSIIITVYNIGKYLKQCLDSVVNQTLEEIEIIIVNDCSPNQDDEKMCLTYQEKYPKVKYIKNKKNQGLFLSRMIGIEAANGEYIGFVDADDFVEVNMYESMYYEAVKNNVDILDSFANRVNSNGEKLGEYEYAKPSIKYSETPFKDIIDNIKWNYWNKIYRKERIKEAVKIMPKVRITMGEDLLANIIIFYYSKNYLLLEKAFYNYRENPNSATTSGLTLKTKIETLIQVYTQYENIFKPLLDNDIFNEISIKIINHIKEAIIYYAGLNITNQIIVKNVAYDFFKQNNQNTDFFTDFKLKSPSTLNIGLIGYTSNGGAGIATQRLHQGLLDTNINCSFFLLKGFSKTLQKSNYYIDIPKKQNFDLTHLSNKNIYSGNTIFSLSYPSLSFTDLEIIVKNNDIINLHWIPRILSTEAIAYLSHSDKPIVWTFHDINPLTGGCHYFHGCENWKTDCMNCPQLIDNYDNYPANILAAKKKYINFKNITVVVLNQHFKKLVEQSPLFNDSRIEVIPNSIDTDRFIPLDKKQIRKKLGLEENKKYLLYVADYASTIKGYKEFEQTIDEYEKRYSSDNIEILLAGNLPKERNIKLPFKEFGHVDEDKIIELYSASDVTVLSSIEDNLPNVILESFSCGTPIVGFKVGGLPDMIEDGYNGYTVELGDIKGLADSINKVLGGKDLSKNCREYAEENLRLEVQAKRYKALYEDLLSKPVNETGKQDLIPENFTETAPTVTKLLNDVVSYKDTQLKQQDTQLKQQDTQLKQQDTQLKQQDTQLKQQDTQLKQQDTQLKQQDTQLKQQDTQLKQQNQVLHQKGQKLKQQQFKINTLLDNRWYRFGRMSKKRKIWTIGKVVSKKIKLYWLLQPIAKPIKKYLENRTHSILKNSNNKKPAINIDLSLKPIDNKVKIFIQANCQSFTIKNIFQNINRLKEKYEIIDIEAVHMWKQEDFELIINKVKECDIFLHQPISEESFGQFASNNIKSYLKKTALTISFPNLHFTGYHPQAFYLKDNYGKHALMPFDYHDSNIFKFFKEGLTEDEILENINNELFYSDKEIERNINQSLKDLQKREKHTDIIISDYIEKNMIGTKLFHVINHPTNELIFELFNKILMRMDEKILNNEEKLLFKDELLGGVSYPIYPSLQKWFKIDEEFSLNYYGKKYTLNNMINIYIDTYKKTQEIGK